MSGPISDSEQTQARIFHSAVYDPILSNWYKAKPYGFKFTNREGKAFVMFLPINPSNLTITTNFATNVVPTLYGTVEEHSPVRYHDITIEGTTGMAPRFIQPFDESAVPVESMGRSSFVVKQQWNVKAEDFFHKTLNTAQNVFDSITDRQDETVTGLQLEQTGYLAFHNLYRFLLQYKKDTAGTDQNRLTSRAKNSSGEDVHPLIFFNYKDNNQYKVVVRSMTLRRDKEDPMLYYYHISMRGYDLAGLGDGEKVDSFKDTLADLGLGGMDNSSFLTEAKELASKVKNILSMVGNEINQLGR